MTNEDEVSTNEIPQVPGTVDDASPAPGPGQHAPHHNAQPSHTQTSQTPQARPQNTQSPLGRKNPHRGRSASARSNNRTPSARANNRTPGSRANSRKAAERLARKAVGKIVSDSTPDTQPIPIVTVLKGTPYQAPVQAEAPNDDESRMILDLAIDLGGIMMRAGAATVDVEVSVIATCTALGLGDAEVDLTSNSLTVHYTTPDGKMLNAMRVNRGEATHYAKLSAVHKLVTDLVDGNVEYFAARSRLDAIRSQRRPYPEWMVTLSWGLLTVAFVNIFGGSVASAAIGFVMAVFMDWFGKRLGGTGMPRFFIVATQSLVTAFVAMLAWTFDIVSSPAYIIAAGIVLLLPTQSLISAVQDALTNFPVTAVGRMVGVVMTFAGIISGTAVGLLIGRAIGLAPIEVIAESKGIAILSTILSLVSAFVIAATGAIGMQASKRIILPAGCIGLTAYTSYVVLLNVKTSNILAAMLAATVVGFLARPIAQRLGAPAIVLIIPAIYTLLQGMSIFSAVFEMVQPEASVPLSVGLSSLFAGFTANASLAVGAVLGNFLAQPLMRAGARRRGGAQADSEPAPQAGGAASSTGSVRSTPVRSGGVGGANAPEAPPTSDTGQISETKNR